MDSTEKGFFSKMFDMIHEDIVEIKDHQKKTCDELDEYQKTNTKEHQEVRERLIRIEERQNHHLDENKKNADRKFSKGINRPQWIVAIGTVLAVTVAVVTLLNFR